MDKFSPDRANNYYEEEDDSEEEVDDPARNGLAGPWLKKSEEVRGPGSDRSITIYLYTTEHRLAL